MKLALSRRSFLRAGSFGIAVSLAGCTMLGQGNDESVCICEIGLINDDGQPRTVDILVTSNDEIIHWNTYKLEAASNEGSTKVLNSSEWFEDWPAQLTIHVRHEDSKVLSREYTGEAGCRSRVVFQTNDGHWQPVSASPSEDTTCSS